MRRNIFVAIGILLYCLAIILPAVLYGYIYPNESDDTAGNISFIMRMVNGEISFSQLNYWGYVIVGYPLYYFAKYINIDFNIVFMWVNITLPLIMSGVLYFVFSRLISKTAGYFALIIPVLVSGASLYYVYQGIFFNLVNVMILYPLLIYFVLKWLTEHKVYQLISVMLLTVLVSIFHLNGLYLPSISILAMLIYIIYCLIKKNHINKTYIWFSFTIFVVSMLCNFLIPGTSYHIRNAINYAFGNATPNLSVNGDINEVYKSVVSYSYFIRYFLSFFVLALFVISIIKFNEYKNELNNNTKISLYIFGCWAIVLLVMAYTRFSTVPFRQQLDFAIVFAFGVTVLISYAIKNSKIIFVISCLLIIASLYPQFIPYWFENNSAIKEADKQTIEYVNSLNYDTYNCSPTVSKNIYDVYLDAKYDFESEILIMRNLPQTQGSDVDSVYYKGYGTESTDGYILDKVFNDGVVEIKIYLK